MAINNIDDGGPAYPSIEFDSSGSIHLQHPGMSLRDYYIGLAMQVDEVIIDGKAPYISDERLTFLVNHWGRVADAMIKARKQ